MTQSPELTEREKKLIVVMRTNTTYSWQGIADLLNELFPEDNRGGRVRDTIYNFMQKHLKNGKVK